MPDLLPFAAAGMVVVGVLLGERRGPGTGTDALVAAGLLGAVGAIALHPGRIRGALVIVAIALAASGAMQRSLHGLVDTSLGHLAETHEQVRIVGTLVGDPGPGRFVSRALVRVGEVGTETEGDGLATSVPVHIESRVVAVAARDKAAQGFGLLGMGERVVLDGRFAPLSGFDGRLRWKHAVAGFDARDLVAATPSRSPFQRSADGLRSLILRGTALMPSTQAALVSGFLLGETRAMPSSVTQDFRAAGLSHLLAVSGANVAFVLGLVGPLLRRFQLAGRLLGGLMILGIFGIATRWEPSVLRAIAMASISMLAAYLGRPTQGSRVLCLAMALLLLGDPFLLHSVGFLLSCGASTGITLFSAPIEERVRGPQWFRSTASTTMAAQLGVAPIILSVFGVLPLVAIPANLLAVPVSGVLTVMGLCSAVVAGLVSGWSPRLAGLLQFPVVLLASYVQQVAALAANVPIVLDVRGSWAALALGSAVSAMTRVWRLRSAPRWIQPPDPVPIHTSSSDRPSTS